MVIVFPTGTDLILVTLVLIWPLLYQVTLIHLGFTGNW